MKKVRYTAGALGTLGLLPAAALLAPAASAATTHHTPATHSKSVRLHSRAGRALCDAHHSHSSSADMRGYISFSRDNGCIGFVEVHRYHGSSRGLEARVRYYDGGVQQGPTTYLHGVIVSSNNSVRFSSFPHVNSIAQVCEAIVNSKTHSLLKGPVCEQTGF